jgi:hypothetical protein
MTGALHLVDGESSYASPELALVDAVLAAELRRGLRLVEDSWVPPRAPVEEAPTAIEEDEPAEPDLGDVLGVAASREVEPLGDDAYIVEVIDDTWGAARASVEEALIAIDEDAPARRDLADVLRDAESDDVKRIGADEYIVEVVEESIVEVIDESPARAETANSHYPILPSPQSGEEAIEETDAALRQIRERMTDEPTARKKGLRRRFTVASGVSVVLVLGIVAVDVQLHVAQLPGWLRF